MTYRLTTNLDMPEFPHASVQQSFEDLDDLLKEVRDSLVKCPNMKLSIEVYRNDPENDE